MDTSTGEILTEDKLTEEQMKSGKFVQLNPELEKKLSRMNRAGRRKYYATHKEEFHINK